MYMTDSKKIRVALLVVLLALFVVWFMPVNRYSNELKEDLQEYYGAETATDQMNVYKELRPNVYNLAFGGEKEAKFNGIEIEVDYDDSVNPVFKFVFITHVLLVIGAIASLNNEDKAGKAVLLAGVALVGISFFAGFSDALSSTVTALTKYEPRIKMSYVKLGVCGWLTFAGYLAALSLAIINFDNKD